MCLHVAGRGFIASRCECKLLCFCGDLFLVDFGGSFDLCYPFLVVVIGTSFKKLYALIQQQLLVFNCVDNEICQLSAEPMGSLILYLVIAHVVVEAHDLPSLRKFLVANS